MNEELKDCFEAVRDSVNAARAHYQIWFTLRSQEKAIDHYYDDMSDYRYVDFFSAINSGNYKLMFIESACIFDTGSRTNRIRRLKELLDHNGYFQEKSNIESALAPYSGLVENILTIRSKLIAHKEASVDPKDLYKKHGIKPNDIKSLLDKVAGLLYELERKLYPPNSGGKVIITYRWEDATFQLLNVLKSGRVHN